MGLEVQIKNWDEVQRRWGEAPDVVRDQFQKAIDASLPEMRSAARRETPVLTGRLKAGIEYESQPLKGVVMSTVYYGVYVHKRNPFMERAIRPSQDIVIQRFQQAIDNILNHLK